MPKANRRIWVALLLALLVVPFPGRAPAPVATSVTPTPPLAIPPAVYEAIRDAVQNGDPYLDLELQAESLADLERVRASVQEAGGEVISEELTFVRARVPAATAESVPQSAPIVAVGVDQQLRLDARPVAIQGEPIAGAQASQFASQSLDALGVNAFRSRYGAQGTGVKVAVIDSGVDPAHPALARTPGGQPKIVDWKDFTGEGLVKTPNVVEWGATYTAPGGRRYYLPPKPSSSRNARFGYLDEFNIMGEHINRDLNRNGLQTDRFGVLLVDSKATGVYDTVYIDTNNDGDFRDQEPLTLFQLQPKATPMGRPRTPGQELEHVNVVVADIDAAGGSVTIGFDGHGHGTQVAGVLGAYDPSGYAGVAPGVQIMALKAMNSAGVGNWFDIKQAIRYAAQHGAQIINISIGGLAAAAAKFDATAPEFLNEIARSGVLIVLAADNTGPGLSSGTTIGNPSEVMAVGAYYSPDMWKRDFGWVVPNETIWSYSGMGPRSDGSYLPSVVAPGGSPTTSPYWIHPTGYTTEIGTSIATPFVSGTAALLMDAGKARGVQHDRLSVKRALELGARTIAGFKVYEQGYGLIAPLAAFGHLQRIDSVPALQARSREGNAGLLARSYTPGSTSFWLTNLDTELARVGIFTQESWVHPAFSTLALPPNVPRELPIEINPPQSPGVHSAFIEVTHPNKHGPSLAIPITYVRPIELTRATEYKYATSERLEVGRYQRFFVSVAPGTDRLDVTARVPLDQVKGVLGTLQVNIFRPDGQAVHAAKIGVNGTGLTTLFSTREPVAGVWEVVVMAEPDVRGAVLEASYTLNVEASPGALAGQPIKLTVPAGSTTTHTIRLQNIFGPFVGHVEAIGLVKADPRDPYNAGRPWRVEKGLQTVVEEFNLREFTSRMRVEISNPVPSNAELNLYLYYLDPRDGWISRGHTDVNEKGIELTNLPAGRYQTVITVNGAWPSSLQYQYRRLMGIEGYHMRVDDPIRKHDRGERWSTDITITAPNTPGRYTGQILVRDTERNVTLGWYPFELSVGEPELSVEAMVAQLTLGKLSSAVLELRNAETGKLVDATITVNGQRFLSRNGRVTVPVTPQAMTQVLDVQVDTPGYRFQQKRITLPVRQSWGLHPIGADASQEFALWRRKVLSQLP